MHEVHMSFRNRTIKVTGFSLKWKITSQLEDLFSRVSQVDRVHLSPDKNAAFVRLAWKESVSFVTEERWEINGEQLYVRPADPSQHPRQNARPASPLFQKNGTDKENNGSLKTYKDYRAGQSHFWRDIPHSNFGPVATGKTKKRRKWTRDHDGVSVPSCEVKKRRKPKTKKRKSKKCAYLVSAKSFEFGFSSTQRICTQDQQLQPEAAEKIHGKDQLEESSQDHSPGPPQEDTQQSVTKTKNNQHLLDGPLTQDCHAIPSRCGGHLPSVVIQVYVKGRTTTVLSLCLPATATQVQERTADLLRVPAELLHITHEGHSLTDKAASRLHPGSNLHCTIKGKGGMEQPEMNNSPGTGGAEEARKQKAFILKEKGNEEYKAAKYEEAVCFYSLSISVIPDAVTINNRAQAYLQLSKWDAALSDCIQVLKMEPKNIKALTRKAKALVGKIDYRQALQNLSMVLLADPSNQDALRLIADVKEEVEKEEKKGQTDIEEKLESSADQKHQDEAVMPGNDQSCQDQEQSEGAATLSTKKKKKKKKKKAKVVFTKASNPTQETSLPDDKAVPQTEADEDQKQASGEADTRAGLATALEEPAITMTDAQNILPTSSEEDVKVWLQSVCCLSEDEIKTFKGIDGLVLFKYKNRQKFMRHTELSLGKARKILYLRDNANTHSPITRWSVGEVVEFVQKIAGSREDVLCFEENQIDGPAFLSFECDEDVEADLKIDGRLAFQIIVRRDKLLEMDRSTQMQDQKQESSGKAHVADTAEPVVNANNGGDFNQGLLSSQQKIVDDDADENDHCSYSEHVSGSHNPVDCYLEEDVFAPYRLLLQDDLYLQPLATVDKRTLVKCKLHVLYHKRVNLNKLEKQFLFMVLGKPELFQGRNGKLVYSKLWTIITDHVPGLFFECLSQDQKGQFTRSEAKELLLFENKPVSFESVPAKISPLPEYEKTRKHDQCPTKILIVDEKLLHEKCPGYTFELRIEKKLCDFNFGFDSLQEYFFFDSDDFGSGIASATVPRDKAGEFNRCRFVLENKFMPTREVDNSGAVSIEDDTETSDSSAAGLPLCVSSEDASDITLDGQDAAASDRVNSSKNALASDVIFGATGDTTNCKAESSDTVLDSQKPVEPRPFKYPKWKYEKGILQGIESGEGIFMFSRSVELKFQDGCQAQDDKAKRSFLYKSLEFVCGCLNGRQDGTIYFGVAEKVVKDLSLSDGQIVGIEMDQQLAHHYYDLFHEFIRNCFPGHHELVKACVTGPLFLPVLGTDPVKFVIEIDIEACSNICEDTVFTFHPSKIFEKYGKPGSKHIYTKNEKIWTGIFRRDGSETMYYGDKEKKEFVREVLPILVKKREEEDKKEEQSQSQLMFSPEADKLKSFIDLFEPSMFPVLLLPKLSKDDKQKNLQFFQFIHHIRWTAVFDFDSDSDRDGLFIDSLPRRKFEIHEATVFDFEETSVEELKEKLFFFAKAAWIFSNGKSTGEKSFKRLERSAWKDQYWTYIQTAIHAFYKNKSVIPPARRLALIIVSDEVNDGIVETAIEIKNAFSWDNIFFVFRSKYSRDYFKDELGSAEKLLGHSVVMQWQHVHHVVCECLNLRVKNRAKYVHTASGANVPIEADEWQAWNDIEILSTRECEEEWEGMSRKKRREKAAEDEKHFYQGKPVSWWNFFWTSPQCLNHVMERPAKSKLLTHIRNIIQNTETHEADRVPIVSVPHMPGAGGTTLCKSVLWNLRKTFKCAVINKITENTENHVCLFWESAEGESAEGELDRKKLQPVVLLADNLVSDPSALNQFDLCRKLHRKQIEYRLSKPLAILIHCFRDVNVQGEFQLTHKLSKWELDWFEEKHERLESQHVDGVETLIAFLAMRNNFEREKLQDTIVQFVSDKSLLPNERELVGYISLITKYFPVSEGSPGIPVTSCDELMRTYRNDFSRAMPWESEKVLSKGAQILLVREYRYECSRWYVRIANQPYARIILDTILEQDLETLGGIVIKCLNSALVSNPSPSRKTVVHILSKMLIERQVEEETAQITHLSPLLTDIKESGPFSEAVSVLLEGYKTIKNEVFYQQLARLYMVANEFDKAKQYAQLAVDLSPEKKIKFKHTLGVVHLRIFLSVSSRIRFNQTAVSENIDRLVDAFSALRIFTEQHGLKDDDVLHICYTNCEIITVVNNVLQFAGNVLLPKDTYRFGRYLTEEGYCFPLFDEKPGFKDALKPLISHGIRALRFMYRVGYSYRLDNSVVSFQSIRVRQAITKARLDSVKQFQIFARMLRTFCKQPDAASSLATTDAERIRQDNYCRFEIVKLGGCFFERIFYLFKYLEGKQRHKRSQTVDSLKHIKSSLDHIYEMNFADMDNLMTVSLALELAGEGKDFTRNTKYNLYKLCAQIISTHEDIDEVLRMRAHMYRVLLIWPNEPRECFNDEQFRWSFHHKSSQLVHEKEPLLPKVHFFIKKSLTPMYLCHSAAIYGDDNDEPLTETEMSKVLQSFSGRYKVVKKADGDQFSCIEMHWDSACGKLNLKIWKIRGLKVFRDETVDFYLGFSLHGPVAFIHTICHSGEGDNGD